jgi:hypothetical protein
MIRRSFCSVILLCLVVLTVWTSSAEAGAQWTVMFYMIGDNNLETAGINNFLKLAQVGSDANLNLVVQLDRSNSFDTSYGDWSSCKRYLVTPGLTPTPENALADLGQVNMGAPNTLRDFINWATSNYPADRYALIIYDHGNGWRQRWESLWKALPLAQNEAERQAILGQIDSLKSAIKSIGQDDSFGGDGLDTSELKKALDDASTKVDLLVLEACLMGMVEVAYEVRNSGPTVFVGSEAENYLNPLPYVEIFSGLKSHLAWTPAELATYMVDQYNTVCNPPLTMSAIDLTQMGSLANQISELANALRFKWDYDMNAVRNAALYLKNAIATAVLRNSHGPDWPLAHGLAIYFPSYQGELSGDYIAANLDFLGYTPWKDFLLAYYQHMLPSYVSGARAQTQQFDFPQNVDLYDFCDKLSQSQVTLWEALDFPYTTWTAGGTGEFSSWMGQTNVSINGGDAAQSISVTDDHQAWLRTTVSGPGTIFYYWKVSSELNFDWLEFYIDSNRQGRISGEQDWQLASFPVPPGLHTLEWRYSKDGSLFDGLDRGWVDWVLYSMDFKTALDNQSLNFTSGGYAGWIGQTKDYLIGGSAARNLLIPDSQSSWLQTTVTGPGSFSFNWKVSSEANFDFLEFYLDGSLVDHISGEVDWTNKSIIIPAGSHEVKWQYRKDGSKSYGADCGWVDGVSFTAASSLNAALDNNTLTFNTFGSANWVGQSQTFFYGGAAAQSGYISDNQASILTTVVTGPGIFTFMWKVSSEANFDWLKIYLDNTELDGISGEAGWQQKTLTIPGGTHLVWWAYTKDGSLSKGMDAGWVDKVTYRRTGKTPGPLLLLLD